MEAKYSVKYSKILGEVILWKRKSEDLNQTEFASLLGLSQSAMARIERGEQNVTISQLRKIAFLFDHTPSKFLQIVDCAAERFKTMQIDVLYELDEVPNSPIGFDNVVKFVISQSV